VWADLELALAIIGGWFLTMFAGAGIALLKATRRSKRMDQQQRLELDEDRRLRYALTIPCMKCGAGVGAHCTTEHGEYAVETHKVRQRQAAMKPNA
jgi:hypothetical protein